MTAEKICVFGDSLAKGVVFDQAKQKYGLIRDGFVDLACAALRIIPKNFSKFGCTITKGSEILNTHVKELADYDLTVLEFGGNDCDFDWVQIAANPQAEHQPKTPLGLFAKTYAQMIETVRNNGGHPVILNLPPIEPKRFFDWISRGLDADAILRWLGGRVDFIYRWHESYSIEIGKLARQYDVPVVDIRSAFLLRPDYATLLCEDGMHPNQAGHQVISRTLEEYADHYLAAANAAENREAV